MKIRREAKIGLVIVLTALLFIWGVNYLKGTDLFTKQVRFFAVYDQVSGLIESNAVTISGVKIGQVQNIAFHPDGSGRIVVEAIVDKVINIPDNSIARLYSSDILGKREIEILLGDSKRLIQSGDTLETKIQATLQDEVSLQLLPFKKQAENLLAQIDSVMAVIQYIFNEKSRANIAESLENIKLIISNFERTTHTLDTTFYSQAKRIATIISNAESITTNIEKNNKSITAIIQNFEAVSDSLASANIKQTINNANLALEEFEAIMAKINKGEGSVGLLIHDESLYKNLEGSSKQLEKLIEDIKEDPRKYFNISVFGK
ncbi:MAG: MCE family protein [Bacteroidetes bacterium]|nr:MCE family protein [Bacteroidota bacterium]